MRLWMVIAILVSSTASATSEGLVDSLEREIKPPSASHNSSEKGKPSLPLKPVKRDRSVKNCEGDFLKKFAPLNERSRLLAREFGTYIFWTPPGFQDFCPLFKKEIEVYGQISALAARCPSSAVAREEKASAERMLQYRLGKMRTPRCRG